MTALKGCRWSLLFLLGLFLLQLHLVRADPLKTLKKYSACISPCFETCDPDYDAACVCNLLVQDPDSVNATVTCIGGYCNPEFAEAIFPDFGKECSIFLNKPIIFNGKTIQTLPMPTPSATRIGIATMTSTYLPELTPTSSPDSNTTSIAIPPSIQTSVVSPTESSSQSVPQPLVAVYVLVPIALVVLLVAISFFWRRRNQRRSSVNSTGWDSSQNPIVGEPMNSRGDGGEGRVTIRVVPRSISQVGARTPSPLPAPPPPARQPSIGRRAKDFARRLMDKELPGLPLNLSITTRSEVSEAPKLPERGTGTHRTTDSEDELRRMYREVRKGFRSQSTASSAVTSMDWSMAGTSQAPDAKGPSG